MSNENVKTPLQYSSGTVLCHSYCVVQYLPQALNDYEWANRHTQLNIKISSFLICYDDSKQWFSVYSVNTYSLPPSLLLPSPISFTLLLPSPSSSLSPPPPSSPSYPFPPPPPLQLVTLRHHLMLSCQQTASLHDIIKDNQFNWNRKTLILSFSLSQ